MHQHIILIGGGKEVRTPDPLLAKQVLSQLSYTPITIRYWSSTRLRRYLGYLLSPRQLSLASLDKIAKMLQTKSTNYC